MRLEQILRAYSVAGDSETLLEELLIARSPQARCFAGDFGGILGGEAWQQALR